MRIINKKALHNFHILETLEAGIVLSGPEVKSVKGGHVELSGSYVKILDGEVFLINAIIPKYQQSGEAEYDQSRTRKLLLHKAQINSILGKNTQKGVALVPVAIYEKNNRLKLEIGIGKSKKEFDKRRVVKERDSKRREEQEFRGKE